MHVAEEGGFWAEVPTIPGCVAPGETMEELRRSLQDAIEGCLSVDLTEFPIRQDDRILEIAV